MLALDLPALADATTKFVIAALTLVAAAVVVIGLVKAVRERRRPQLVISDITALGGATTGPPADAVNLSPWLRQRVRYALTEKRLDADWILGADMLGRDIELGRLPVQLSKQSVAEEVTSAARDTLATLKGGLKAVAPLQADGLLGALATALPAPRGQLVSTASVAREHPAGPQLGLAIEVHELDGTPAAAILLWDWPDAELQAHERVAILVETAAEWIALRLVAFQLLTRAGKGTAPGLPHGVRRLLSGAMVLNVMRAYPQFALALGEEAEADLRVSQDLLGRYHRPSAIRAAVLEQVAFAQRRSAASELARATFSRATEQWQDAIDRLARNSGTVRDGDAVLADEFARLRLRMLKCMMLSQEPDARMTALESLRTDPLRFDYHPRTLYNAACLCALLLPEHLDTAWQLLGRALLRSKGTELWRWALRDPDLEPLPDRQQFIEYLQIHGQTEGAGIDALIEAALGRR